MPSEENEKEASIEEAASVCSDQDGFDEQLISDAQSSEDNSEAD